MAQIETVELVDDLDESPATRTIRFGWAGRDYEIDLNDAHARDLQAKMEALVAAGRPAGRSRRRTTADRQRSAQIRQRARVNGVTVSDRGRLPMEVITEYGAAS